jgi:maltose alpha-D-glucosyltransferase/alpha-amylase
MGDNLELEGRLSVRTPMQWAPGPTAGFTTATEGRLVRPCAAPPYGPDDTNVREQNQDGDSFLSWIRRLTAARRSTRAIGLGPVRPLDLGYDDVVGWCMEWDGETVTCVHNLSAEDRTVEVETLDSPTDAEVVFADDRSKCTPGSTRVDLAGYGYHWWRIPIRAN